MNKELEAESPRGAIVLAASYVDEMLHSLILASFRNHAVSRELMKGALNGLTRRARLAFALELNDDRDLAIVERLASVRNEFAHKTIASLLSSSRIEKEMEHPAFSGHGDDRKRVHVLTDELAAEVKLSAIVIVDLLAEKVSALQSRSR